MLKQKITDALILMLSAMVMLQFYISQNAPPNTDPKCSDYEGADYKNGVVVFDTSTKVLKVKCEGLSK